VLFPNSIGGRIDINNWRSREWAPALTPADVEHRRIHDMRHVRDVESRGRMSIFTLSRRIGTRVPMIDQTYQSGLGSSADGAPPAPRTIAANAPRVSPAARSGR
jgi:hypothetical protein